MFASILGKSELEDVAAHLVKLSQGRGSWLQKFTAKSVKVSPYWLDLLTDRGWLQKSIISQRSWVFWANSVSCYSITDAFATHIYRAQQRNLRIWDPTTPTTDSDRMRAIGLIPEK